MINTPSRSMESATESAMLQTLAYFEGFSYPLTQEEVFAFCTEASATREEVFERLQILVSQGHVFQYGFFYQSKEEAAWVERRLEANRRADAILPRARMMARFIGQFPFVRAVFVSGSLSKHCMRPESDVDFFIVMQPGRLWLGRTLLVLFKKIFLLNSHKYFCVNYFVDTGHLEIEEKNLFTATEAVTLLPMWGALYYGAFCTSNPWVWQQFPHFAQRSTQEVPQHSRTLIKKLMEKILAGTLGNWLDKYTMRLTVDFWKRKFSHLDPSTFDLALRSRKGVSKHHPLHFQEKVLAQLEENFKALKQRRYRQME